MNLKPRSLGHSTNMAEAMKAAQPPRKIHSQAADCWCEPHVFEPCSECRPFEIEDYQDDPEDAPEPRFTADQNRRLAIIGAVAVHVTVPGAIARRPKKSKGCWKCSGDGVRAIGADEPREHGFVFHKQGAS